MNSTLKRSFIFDPPESSTPKKICKVERRRDVLSQEFLNTVQELAGVIKIINVQNFMCHDHFEMHFNPRINFISGRNGSGKSAIQTALIIGLGGDVRATSRGTALTSFIKEGKNQATIQITMINIGSRAYKPDIYGNEFTVIRNLSKISTFKIRAANGKIYPVKKAEIIALVQRFQIQATNPVAILNQNTARTFLKSADPKEKYKLFMEATLFELIFAKKNETKNNLQIMCTILDDKKRILAGLEIELKKDKDQLVLIEKCRRAVDRKSELENEMVWCEVVESERVLSQSIQRKESLEVELKKIEEAINTKEEREQQLLQRIDKIEKAISEQLKERKIVEKKYNELKGKKDELNRKNESIKTKEEGIRRKVKVKENDNRHIRAEMDDYERKKEQHDQKKMDAMRKKNELEQKYQDIAAAKRTLNVEYENAKSGVENAASEINQRRNKLKHANMVLNQKEERLQKDSSGTSLEQYGPYMATVVEQVKEAYKRKKFSELPRGPLGSYIKMKDPKWAALAESTLGSTLRMFAVNCRADEKVLQSIFDRVLPPNVKLPISCVKFINQPFENIKEAEYNNVFSNMEISDPVVSNILLDLTSCQKTILIEDNETAFHLLSNAHNVPKNTSIGYTLDGSRHFPNIGRSVYKTYQGSLQSKTPRYVKMDQTSFIRNLKTEIKEIKASLSELQQDVRNSEQELIQCQQSEREIGHRIKSLNSKMMAIKDELNRSVVDEGEEFASMDLYQTEFVANQKEIDKLLKEIEDFQKQRQSVQADMDELSRELSSLNPKMKDTGPERCAEVEDMKEQLSQFQAESSNMQRTLQENQTKITHLSKRIVEEQKAVEERISRAEMLVERKAIPDPREKKIIEEELLEVDTLIEKAEEISSGNPRELEKRIKEKLENFCKSQTECAMADKVYKKIDRSIQKREKALQFLLLQTIESTKISFNTTLSVRGYSGELHFNTDKKTLDMMILPKKDRNAKLKDTASLSGGERSYTTVAFIMALWNGMAVPFFSMDEFDVFMDSVNRKFIMDLLLMSARSNRMMNRQFLFLTPLDCSILDSSSDLTIHKMKDPERYGSQSQR